MNQVLSEVFATDASLLVATDITPVASASASTLINHFPYAEAVLAGLHRTTLLDNLAAEAPSDAQLGQFTRWLRRRGVLAAPL